MNSLFWRFLRSYVLVLVVTILAVGLPLSYLYTESLFKARADQLLENGQSIAARFRQSGMRNRPAPGLWLRTEGIASALNAWIVYADTEGLVQLASQSDPRLQGLRLSPDDVRRVILEGEEVTRRGYEETLGEVAVTALVPVFGPGEVVGAIVLYSPVRGMLETLHQSLRLLLIASVVAIVVGTVASYALSRRLVTPLEEMTEVARHMADGDFSRRVRSGGRDELDILGTALNKLAAQLGESIDELRREKRKTESIVKGISEGVIAASADGRILLANPTAAGLAGASGPIEGTRLEDHPALARLADAFAEAIRENRTVRMHEVRFGEKVYTFSIAPLPSEDDRSRGGVGILHDVSERFELEQMQRAFVANVSHELRTPLTSIRGFAQAILEGVVTGEKEVARRLRVIMDEALRLIRLTDTLLDLSKLQAKAIPLAKERVDVAEVVGDVVEVLTPKLHGHNVEIRLDLPRLPEIWADPDRLAQVLLNLLDNAIRHTPAGGAITVRGEASQLDEGGWPSVILSIEDEGPGIPEKDLPRIWDRFYKVDKSRRSERGVGTGLGLVIVRELVAMHGGRATVCNRPQGGAAFRVELPVDPPEADQGRS